MSAQGPGINAPDAGSHTYFYNWLISIYLLLVEGRSREAEFCLEKISRIASSPDQANSDFRFGEGLVTMVNRFQKDFDLRCSYRYDEFLKRIIIK